jgi:hypothetical protein
LLDPLALATPETEAVYSPFECSTLPLYCFPATVVEKLVAISSSAELLLALPPPPPLPPLVEDELVCELCAP